MKLVLYLAGTMISVLLAGSGCNKQEELPVTGTFTDSRDGQSYRYVTIGSQVWMAENLRYLPTVSPTDTLSSTEKHFYVCGYEGENVEEARSAPAFKTYGVLYNWPAAMDGDYGSKDAIIGGRGVCPSGWHLPGDQEWKNLEEYLGMEWSETIDDGWRQSGRVGAKLKEIGLTHWAQPNLGATDSLGFSALPGGYLDKGKNYCTLKPGEFATFWTTKAYCPTQAWYRSLSATDAGIGRFWYLYSGARSVRCVRDEVGE